MELCLKALDEAIASVMATPGVEVDATVRAALHEAVRTAHDAGHGDPAQDLLTAAARLVEQRPRVYNTLFCAMLREHDGRIPSRTVEGFAIERVDLDGTRSADSESLQLSITSARDTILYPIPLGDGEVVEEVFVGDVQIFDRCPVDGPHRDATALRGRLRDQFLSGAARRIAWGGGCCAITERRVLGVIFDTEAHVNGSAEAQSLPECFDYEHGGTVVAFTCDRELLSSCDAVVKTLSQSAPAVGWLGEVAIGLHAAGVLRGAEFVRPDKNYVANVARSVPRGR